MIKQISNIKEVRISGLKICLDIWSNNQLYNDRDLGAKTMNLLRGEGDGYGDPEALDAKEDNRIAAATDTMIHELPTCQWWAIKKSRGISTAWRFTNIDYEKTLIVALEQLELKLRKHPDTWNLF